MTDDHRERQQRLDQGRLDTFVVRARRVAAHSMAQDRKRLDRLARGEVRIQVAHDRVVGVEYDYPPEEVVESAAARVRPLLMKDASLLGVLKSLRSMTAETPQHPSVREWAVRLRAEWNQRVGDAQEDGGYTATVQSLTTGESNSATSKELARAWIYGDVIHHDANRLEQTKGWDVSERFRAAVPMVAFAMARTLDVLNAVSELEQLGALTVSADSWQVDVTADLNRGGRMNVFMAPVGSVVPEIDEPFGPEWTPLGGEEGPEEG